MGVAGLAALLLTTAALGHDVDMLLNPSHPEWRKTAPDRYIVRLDTSRGEMRAEVLRVWAPLAADRFFNLVRFGYYDDARFFRVVSGRWAQFGINGDPRIARAWRYQALPDEPRRESNVRGTLAFAWAVPSGRATQVFVNLRDNSSPLDEEGFAPFGRLVAGLDVADALYAGYGEESGGGIRGGRQEPLFAGGNTFLIRNYPNLDYIRRATIER